MGYGRENEHVIIRTDYPEISAQLAQSAKKLEDRISIKQYENLVVNGDWTVAIQKAIDDAQLKVNANGTAVPIIYFPAGEYHISNTITWKTAHLTSAFPSISTRIYWDGDPTKTAFVRDATATGGNSFGQLSGLSFRKGLNQPNVWLDLSSSLVDFFCKLSLLHFSDCTSDAIKVGNLVNCHWENLRFDNIGGYAIRFTPTSQHLSSFVLDKFTYDHHITNSTCEGFIMIDNTAGNVDLGVFSIRNGRLEVNTPWVGKQAIITVKLTDNTTVTRSAGIHLSDFAYQDGVSMANDVLLYRDTANTTAVETLILENFNQDGLSNIFGGTWADTSKFNIPLPADSRIGHLALNVDLSAFDKVNIFARNFAGQTPVTLKTGNEQYNRLSIDNTGKIQWGSGTAVEDINLYRSTANTLKTDDKLVTSLGIGVGNSATATTLGTVTKKMEVFDASGNSLGFVPIYNSIT